MADGLELDAVSVVEELRCDRLDVREELCKELRVLLLVDVVLGTMDGDDCRITLLHVSKWYLVTV